MSKVFSLNSLEHNLLFLIFASLPNWTVSAILIIDDLETDCEILHSQLLALHIQNPIRKLPSCDEGKAYLERTPAYANQVEYPPPSAIFLDILMPGMDGFQFLLWVKSRPEYQRVLIIVISGDGNLNTIRRAYQLGAASFLTKPWSLKELENLFGGFPAPWIRSPAVSERSAHSA